MTREQARRLDYEGPVRDQKKLREAGRVRDLPLTCHLKGQITEAQYRASQKLYTHLVGREGVRVQQDEANNPLNADTEFPRFYHGEKVAQARIAVGSDRAFMILEQFVGTLRDPDGYPYKLEEIARQSSDFRCPKMSRGFLLGHISVSLDSLVKLWGLE